MLIHQLVNRALRNIRYRVNFERVDIHEDGEATITVSVANTLVRYRGDGTSWRRLPDGAEPPESMARILALYWRRHVQPEASR